jgi:hypothetical protein
VQQFIYNNVEHFLCFFILLSRLGDIVSTYLVSPTLKLESNPIVRKLGFRFTFLTLALCVIPYYHVGLALVVVVPSLLVASSNMSKYWAVKTYGEQEYARRMLVFASQSKFSHALLSTLMSSFFIILAGLVLLLLSLDTYTWGYWFGSGIILYGVIMAMYGSLALYILFKKARKTSQTDSAQEDTQGQ